MYICIYIYIYNDLLIKNGGFPGYVKQPEGISPKRTSGLPWQTPQSCDAYGSLVVTMFIVGSPVRDLKTSKELLRVLRYTQNPCVRYTGQNRA